MKFHRFVIISLCNFILLVCYTSKAQTVSGAAPATKLKVEFSGKIDACKNTSMAAANCRLGVLYEKLNVKCSHESGYWNDSLVLSWYYSKDGSAVKSDNNPTLLKGTNDGRVKVSDGLLEISQLLPQDINYYACRVTSKKSASEKEELVPIVQEIFEIQALPIVSSSGKDITVVEGNQINITCTVVGKASRVVWKFGEKNLVNGSDERVTLKDFKGIPDAMLLISQANATTDRGTYNCQAVSDYGNSSAIGATFVRIKSKYAAFVPFLGICAEVIILCTIILIYEKKRDKTELEESDTDQGPETKSSPDHGQDSVRYRK